MKKISVFLGLITLLMASCKKDNDAIVQPVQKDMTMTNGAVSAKNVSPGNGIVVQTTNISVGNVIEPGIDKISFAISGTAPLTNQKNVRVTIKNEDSVVVFDQVVKTTASQTFTYSSFIMLDEKQKYVMTTTMDLSPGTIGTTNIVVTIDYSWFENDDPASLVEKTIVLPGPPITVTPYGSMPIFTWTELPGTIVDSVEIAGYEFSITNPGTTRMSFAQFTMMINIVDVGNDDTIRVINPKWSINGVDATSRVQFVNNAGVPTISFPEGYNKFFIPYVTGNREMFVEPGETVTIRFTYTPVGLNHNGNGISTQLLMDDLYISPGYINLASPYNYLKITTSMTGTTGTTPFLIWSPFTPTSAIPGNSTKTYVGSNGLTSLPVQYNTQ